MNNLKYFFAFAILAYLAQADRVLTVTFMNSSPDLPDAGRALAWAQDGIARFNEAARVRGTPTFTLELKLFLTLPDGYFHDGVDCSLDRTTCHNKCRQYSNTLLPDQKADISFCVVPRLQQQTPNSWTIGFGTDDGVAVCSFNDQFDNTAGSCFAHEVGHALGASHDETESCDSVMCPNVSRRKTFFTAESLTQMNNHVTAIDAGTEHHKIDACYHHVDGEYVVPRWVPGFETDCFPTEELAKAACGVLPHCGGINRSFWCGGSGWTLGKGPEIVYGGSAAQELWQKIDCDDVPHAWTHSVLVQLKADDIAPPDYYANKAQIKSQLVSELSLSVNQIALSLEDLGWDRRLLAGDQPLTIFVRIQMNDDEVDDVAATLGDQDALIGALSQATDITFSGMEVGNVTENAFCPTSVVPNDSGVSCEAHCTDLGYVAGQQMRDYKCRCRSFIPETDTCSTTPLPLALESVHNNERVCYYDVCTIDGNCDILATGTRLRFTFTRQCVNGWTGVSATGLAFYDANGDILDLANPVITSTGAHEYLPQEILKDVGKSYSAEYLRCAPEDALDDEIVEITLDNPISFSNFDFQNGVGFGSRAPRTFKLEVFSGDNWVTALPETNWEIENTDTVNFGNHCVTPTLMPTAEPTMTPTLEPTMTPTLAPTASDVTVSPTLVPTAEPTDNRCPDMSGCYTFSFDSHKFAIFVPVPGEDRCTYEVFSGSKAGGVNGASPSNPPHIHFELLFSDAPQMRFGSYQPPGTNFDWTNSKLHTVVDGGVHGKTDLVFHNGGVYRNSGYDAIPGCGIVPADSMSPTAVPTQVPTHGPTESSTDDLCAVGPTEAQLTRGGYGCNTNPRSDCVNGNVPIDTLEQAWARCGDLLECTSILKYWDGKYYLRGDNDLFGDFASWSYIPYNCQKTTATCTDQHLFQGACNDAWDGITVGKNGATFDLNSNVADAAACRADCLARSGLQRTFFAFKASDGLNREGNNCACYTGATCNNDAVSGAVGWEAYQITCPPEDVDTNTLTRLGAGRCKANGSMLPLTNYVTRTSKTQCLSDCEADPNCIAAMPAYDYYCQHYMTADVAGGLVDDFKANYQTQWECYAKSKPDQVVTMQMTAQGMSEADFNAQKADVAASMASELGVTTGQIELSLVPFQRRLLVAKDQGLEIYARINARDEDMQMINSKTADMEAFSKKLSENVDGVSFEVKTLEVQPFEQPNSTNSSTSSDKETKGISTIVFAVVSLVCLFVGVGGGIAGYACFIQKPETPQNAGADLEMGSKRLPEIQDDVSLEKLYNAASNSNGGTTLGADQESRGL